MKTQIFCTLFYFSSNRQ